MTVEPIVPNPIAMSSSADIPLNEAALEVLFKKYFTPLCAYCQYKFRFELDVAKEAVHTGFIKLWENRETVSSGPSVKAYLYKIVTNRCLDLLKHEKVKEQHAKYISQNPSANDLVINFNQSDFNQLKSAVDQAIAELPEQMRRIFELSRHENLKYTEIAAKLNISVKTVETQMSRALVKLRQRLAPYLPALIPILLLHL